MNHRLMRTLRSLELKYHQKILKGSRHYMEISFAEEAKILGYPDNDGI